MLQSRLQPFVLLYTPCAMQFHVYRERTYKVINNQNPVPFNMKINLVEFHTNSAKNPQYPPMRANAK
jgi:hypothetical protein